MAGLSLPNRPTLVTTQPVLVMAMPLIRAAERAQWNVVKTGGGVLPNEVTRGQVALYGNWKIVCAVARLSRLCLLAPHAEWICELPHDFTSRQVTLTTWQAALMLKEPTFVKPIDWKSTLTRVYESGEKIPDDLDIPRNARVIISQPIEFEYEFRCFVLERRVMAISPYYHRGQSCLADGVWNAPGSLFDEAREFCETVVGDSRVNSPSAFVLDVGIVEGRGWAVVEAQPCWFSDTYGCDPLAALQVLCRSCRHLHAVGPDDERWVVSGDRLDA